MQTVSREYKESMANMVRNRGYIRASIGIVNTLAQDNAELPSDNVLYGYPTPERIFSGYSVNKPYAMCEQDYSKVNGSMYFTDLTPVFQGAVTREFGGAIKVSFSGLNDLSLSGLNIDFGYVYPTKIRIQTNRASVTFDNDSRYFQTDYQFDNVSYFLITPISWSVPGEHRLRVWSFSSGLTKMFVNDDVISFTQTDYVSSVTDSVSSTDMTLVVDNLNREFNPDDPNSLISYMENGQAINIAFGYDVVGEGNEFDIEWLPPTTAYLTKWSSTDTQASFTAVDRFASMTDTYHKGKYHQNGISLYDLAVDVLDDAGIPDNQYYLDPYLKRVRVTNPIPPITHASALQIIANAGRCTMYTDRQGRIHLQAAYLSESAVTTGEAYIPINSAKLSELGLKTPYSTGDRNHSEVDGSFFFKPDTSGVLDTGYISKAMWSNGQWDDETPSISFNFDHNNIFYGFEMYVRKPYPRAFTIKTYDYSTGDVIEEIHENLSTMADENHYVMNHTFAPFGRATIAFDEGYDGARVFVDAIGFGDATDYKLTRDDSLTASPTATRLDRLRNVLVTKTKFSITDGEDSDLCTEETTIKKGDPYYDVYLSNPSWNYSVECETEGVSATIITTSSYWVRIRFGGITTDKEVKFKVRGRTYDMKELTESKHYNTFGEDVTWSNPLVSSSAMANSIADWLASFYLGDVEYDITWRGDPRVDANDLFFLEIPSGRDTTTDTLIRAFKTTINFNGAWSGSLKARRVVI